MAGRGRVILIGGSGLAFGTDSAAISAAAGRPVVNMGMIAGLGLDYMLREAADGLRAGDLAVLIPEYEVIGGGVRGHGPTFVNLLEFNPAAGRYMGLRQWWMAAQAMAQTNGRQWANAVTVAIRHGGAYQPPAYSTKAFNSDGDAVGHLDLPHQPLPQPYPLMQAQPEALASIERFRSRVRAAGADFVLVFPALAESQFKFNQAEIDKLAAGLTGIPVVGKPEEWVYPDSWFYDTFYHASRQARSARSAHLGQLLYSYLQEHAAQAARR